MASATAPLPVPRSSTARSVGSRQELKRTLDQQLGFRPRHQHRRRDLEGQRPELAPAGQISDRQPPLRCVEQISIVGELGVGEQVRDPRAMSAARVDPEHAAQQHLGIEPRGIAVHAERAHASSQGARRSCSRLRIDSRRCSGHSFDLAARALRPDVPDSGRRSARPSCRS